jgi:hypothetical protein
MLAHSPRLALGLALGFVLAASPVHATTGVLENPGDGSYASGVGLISGWVCQASGVNVIVDNTQVFVTAYGTSRTDTRSICGDSNNGFGVLLNFGLLGNGNHTARAYADGVLFAQSTFQVTTLGVPFMRGVSGRYRLLDFPHPGQSVVVRWQQGLQNFVIDTMEGAGTDVEPGYYRGTTSQGAVCSNTTHPASACEVALDVGSTAPGVFHLEPSSLVDLSTAAQCSGSGSGDFASLQFFARCGEGQVRTFTACNFHPFSGTGFEVEFSTGVTISGICNGFQCSGTISESGPATGCTFPELSWSANMIVF